MKKPEQKALLEQINKEIKLYRPTDKYATLKPKVAKEMHENADLIAEKLYATHALVGEHDSYKIFGYGSLLNARSRARTMTPKSVEYDRVDNFQRIYNLAITQGTCLNVRPKEGAMIDGALCEIDRDDMMQFILREFNYDLLPITTQKGAKAFMVMAVEGKDSSVVSKGEMLKDETLYAWNDVMPRLDYINACYHGVCELAYANKVDHIFLTKDNVLFDEEPLAELIEEISPTIQEVQDDGVVKNVNKLLQYWETIDSAY